MNATTDLSRVFEHLNNDNDSAAIGMLRRLMKAGNVEAAALYGWLMYVRERNRSAGQALAALTGAAESGFAFAQDFLAYLYWSGWHVPEDKKKAAHWYRKAARKDYAPALFALGTMYVEGDGVKQDGEKGVAYLVRAAQQSGARTPGWDLDACHSMAEFLGNTRGEAITFAQENLGIIHANGIGGVLVDTEQAVKWLSLAVSNGSDAANELSQLKTLQEWRRWNRPAFSADDLYAIGRKSELGEGVTKDIAVAVRAYVKALGEDPDHAPSMYALAEIRRNANGDGYLELYERAAKCGHALSILRLSELGSSAQEADSCGKAA